jgi:cytochrome c oxidase subunit 4
MREKDIVAPSTEPVDGVGPATGTPEHWYLYALMLFCVIGASLFSSYLAAGHNWGDDFGAYLHLAKNIQMGRPYGYLTPEMGAMTPPGFPFLMSVWSHVTGWDLIKLKTVNVFAWSALAITTYRLARFYVSAPTSLAAAVAVLCCPFFVFAEQDLISDMPYTVVNTVCLCLACAASTTASDRRRIAWPIALAVGVFVALLFRPAALGLIAGLLGYQGYALAHRYILKRSIDWYTLIGASALLLSTIVFMAVFPGPFRAHGANAVANGHFYSFAVRSAEEFANFTHLFFGFSPITWQAKALLGIMFAGASAAAISRRELTPLHFFAAVYAAMIVFTPWDGGPRYLFPLVPVAFVFVAMLGEYSLKGTVPAWTGRAIAILILLYVTFNGIRQMGAARGYSNDDVGQPKAAELVDWLKANTKVSDTLCAFKPRAIMYLAQRRTLHIGFEPYAGQGSEYLHRMQCAYAAIPDKDALGGLYNGVLAKVSADPTMRKVYDNSMYSVFIPAGATLETGDSTQ